MPLTRHMTQVRDPSDQRFDQSQRLHGIRVKKMCVSVLSSLCSNNICVYPSDQTVRDDPKFGDHMKDVRRQK